MFKLLWQLGTYTETMLTTDILHQLCFNYNVQPAVITLPLKFIYGRTVNSEKSFLLLLHLEVSIKIYKKKKRKQKQTIMYTIAIRFKIP